MLWKAYSHTHVRDSFDVVLLLAHCFCTNCCAVILFRWFVIPLSIVCYHAVANDGGDDE